MKAVAKKILITIAAISTVAMAIGTSCANTNLQNYAEGTVAAEFSPLVTEIDNKITDGSQINSELLYASYLALFDFSHSSSDDKATCRKRLLSCFYYTSQDKDKQGKVKTGYHAVTDSIQIFNNIEREFGIKISSPTRDYIIQFSQTLTNYGSCAIGNTVMAYSPTVSKYCKQYGIPDYAALVLAVMMQESGGNGKDPMQASECGFNTRFPHLPNSIKDPDYSIQCGVEQLASCIKAANCKSPSDMPGISLALQGYNFGNGFIPWAMDHGGYSLANAQSFSEMEATKMSWSSYGDVNYVSHVLRYYSNGTEGSTFRYPIETGKYTISSGYGQRTDPTAGSSEFHKGIDLAAPAGTPIYAAANGTVAYSQYGIQPYGGYGNLVIIRHSSSLISMYGHCSKLLVSVGQAVQKGQEIALVGSTGDSTGNHCHFEIRVNDKSVSPMSYLK